MGTPGPVAAIPEQGPHTVLCTYLPKRDQVGLFHHLLREHWPTLRRLGFVTDDAPLIYHGEDASGPFFVEILTWVDPAAASRAYWCEEVNAIWSQFYEHSEARGSRPAIEYPHVDRIAALSAIRPPSAADPAGSGGVPAPGEALDWDAMYRGGQYRQSWDYESASPELVSLLAAGLVPEGGCVLDLGCGSGKDAVFMATAGYRTSGLDISAEALEIARAYASASEQSVSWHRASALDLPFADEQFDFISDRGCLHHIRADDRPRYAHEVARVLKPGGRLLLRGSAEGRFPFIPITPRSISEDFPEPPFSIGPIRPIRLVTDSGSIRGTIALIRKSDRRGDPTGRQGSCP
jgi:SAM-dependent methyltransferase